MSKIFVFHNIKILFIKKKKTNKSVLILIKKKKNAQF